MHHLIARLSICLFVLIASSGAGGFSPAIALADDAADARLRFALEQALADEQQAARQYQAVLARHGRVLPFANVVEAEHRHEAQLVLLFTTHGVPVPPRAGRAVEAPGTIAAACTDAVFAERANISMYDRLLAGTLPADVRTTFERLRAASSERHLPAFTRCATPIAPPPPAIAPAPRADIDPSTNARSADDARYWSHGLRGHGLGWGKRCRQRARGWTN